MTLISLGDMHALASSLSSAPGRLFSLEGLNQSLSALFDLCQIFWVYFWLLGGYFKRGALTRAAAARRGVLCGSCGWCSANDELFK